MSQFLNLNVWVPVATVLVVLVTSGLVIFLVRHLKRKRQQRYSIKRNSEAELNSYKLRSYELRKKKF